MSPDEMRVKMEMIWMRALLVGRIRFQVEMAPSPVFSLAGLWDVLRNIERGGN